MKRNLNESVESYRARRKEERAKADRALRERIIWPSAHLEVRGNKLLKVQDKGMYVKLLHGEAGSNAEN